STFGEIHDFFKKAKEKHSLICAKRVMLEEYMRKASLEYPGDEKFLALHEKYVNLFKDSISFNDDGNGDNGGDDDDGNEDNDGDDDANDGDGNGDNDGDDDGGNEDNDGDDDVNDGDGNGDEEDANEYGKDPNGRNPSFGFTKIGLDDFGNDSGPTKKDSVDPTEQGTVVEGNLAKECEIMSIPENYTQWLERNADLVGETIDSITVEYLYGDLFGDNSVTMEVMNEGLLTPKRMLTSVSNVSLSPEKRIVKPSCYLLSPYMNKKTKVVPKIKRLEFILGNSLFAMEGDK
nr:ulp1 protease family, C-terminal catalytic domain-containing protein [Tanacetum cinerariifolium]